MQPVEMKANFEAIRLLFNIIFEGAFAAGKCASSKFKNTFPSLSLAKRDSLGFVVTPAFSVGTYPIIRFCQAMCFGPEASRKKLENSVSKKKPADFKKQQKNRWTFRQKWRVFLSGVAGVEFLSGWFNPQSNRTTRECMESLPADIKRVFGNLRSLINYGIKTTLTDREEQLLDETRKKLDAARSPEEKQAIFEQLKNLQCATLGNIWVHDRLKFEVYQASFPEIHLFSREPYSCFFASKEVFSLIRQNRFTAQLVRSLNQRCGFPVDVYSTITECLGGLPRQIELFLLDASRSRYENNTDQEPS